MLIFIHLTEENHAIMKSFALIGAAGYIAPRHMKAIQDTGNQLVAAFDPFDSVGIIDSYFPKADFFTEYERFDRHLEKLKRQGNPIDFVSICSPNYLHDAHIRFGLRHGAEVICEKPLVLNPWNLEALQDIEKESYKKVNCILQLRLHPSVIELRRKVESAPSGTIWDIELTYITSRGHWYFTSWKGDIERSGGIATNIGVHFFDMLMWIFGQVRDCKVHIHSHDRAAGYLHLERARVRWFLCINGDVIPEEIRSKGIRTYRSLKIENQSFEFSNVFNKLHTRSYEQIFRGEGFGIADTYPAIDLIHQIRNLPPIGLDGSEHPMARLPLAPHPFRSSSRSSNSRHNGK